MIDWLTLRTPLSGLGPVVAARVREAMGRVMCISSAGEIQWQKGMLDVDALRSDAPGLCWQVQGSASGEVYLAVGASPARLEHGVNIFGSSDVRHSAVVLLKAAAKGLSAILPPVERWDCRRIDITENYALPSGREVKQALRALLGANAKRARPRSMGGDTVGWNVGSDLQSGKAYAKGPQLVYLMRKGECDRLTDEQLADAERLLRLELTLRARWFRRQKEKTPGWSWLEWTEAELGALHQAYFGRFFGSVEVTDMGTMLAELEKVAPTPGQALAAHRTWAMIRMLGRETAMGSMPRATWFRHQRFLRDAGVSDTDLCAGELVPFRRHVVQLDSPVRSWGDLRAA